ncbi:MAG: alpha/beta hydrolase [Myxococcales bacterium]
MPGQYLERATVVEAQGLALEGLYHRGERQPPALLVAPLQGGSPMELPVVAELAWALHRLGHPTLRYNPRGLGASQGAPGDDQTRLLDARAALTHLLESAGAPRAAVVAVSGGAFAALALARGGGCAGLLCIAPPPALAEALGGEPPVPTRVLLAEADPWPESPLVARIAGADAFLRGLPELGRAAAAFVSRLSG